MNDVTKKLIQQAGFSTTFENDRLEALVNLVVNECVDVIQFYPRTTFERDVTVRVIENTIALINERFGRDI